MTTTDFRVLMQRLERLHEDKSFEVVRDWKARTGGLADTVIDANVAALNAGVATGVQFVGVHYAALAEAITRTVHLHHNAATWKAMQRAAMASDFSWTASGRAYADLYKGLL